MKRSFAVALLRLFGGRRLNPLLNEERLGFDCLAAGVLDSATITSRRPCGSIPVMPRQTTRLPASGATGTTPASALPYAYRAAFWLPGRQYRTLGTVLLEAWTDRCGPLAFRACPNPGPDRGVSLNNLCYALDACARFSGAGDWCRAALAADPGSEQARNNLALSLALSGDLQRALDVLSHDVRPASAAYNQAVLLAARQRSEARDALGRARTADQSFCRR